jgi:hypothetical protein
MPGRAMTLWVLAAVCVGCAAEHPPDHGSTLAPAAIAAPSVDVETAIPDTGESPLERAVIASLTTVGVADPGVSEHGYKDAWIGGDWKRRSVLVHVHPPGRPVTPGKPTGTVIIGGTDVTYVTTEAFGVVGRFSCGPWEYEAAVVSSGLDPGSSTRDAVAAFLALYVPTLGC